MTSHLSLKRYFNLFNRKYFDNQVPSDTRVIWHPLDTCNGEYQAGTIRIDTTLHASPRLTKITLLHEMIHARYPKATHGPVFKAERQRLWDLGAYDKLI